MAWVRVLGDDGARDVELGPKNTVGRHPDNSVQLLDRIVSKEHCHIDFIDGHYELIDLGSLNGTYVNGKRVERSRLSNGDRISAGNTSLIFSEDRALTAKRRPTPPAGLPVSRRSTKPSSPVSLARPSTVTMTSAMLESHIKSKLVAQQQPHFLPEKDVGDESALRADYEKLRASYELANSIGVELDVERLLEKIVDCAFQLLDADRGVVLLQEKGKLIPRCVRVRDGSGAGDEVVLSNTIINEVLRDKSAILSSDALVDSRFNSAQSVIMQGIRSTMAVPLLHTGELFGIMVVDSQVAAGAFAEKDLQLFQNIASQAAIFIQNSLYAKKLEEEAVTRQRFQRLLSPAIAEQVLTGSVEIEKGGELRETTTLFSDIRGFTTMSEDQPPRAIVDMLNEYFERMVAIVFKHEGTLDKFVGDALMALFGAPVAHADDPRRAVQAALEMLDALNGFNAERALEGLEPLHIGIGINTGEAVAGYLGSSQALEYTVIGDAVNVSSRLCSLAKAGEILISHNTYELVRDHFDVVEKPAARLKGKRSSIPVYRVVSAAGGFFRGHASADMRD